LFFGRSVPSLLDLPYVFVATKAAGPYIRHHNVLSVHLRVLLGVPLCVWTVITVGRLSDIFPALPFALAPVLSSVIHHSLPGSSH